MRRWVFAALRWRHNALAGRKASSVDESEPWRRASLRGERGRLRRRDDLSWRIEERREARRADVSEAMMCGCGWSLVDIWKPRKEAVFDGVMEDFVGCKIMPSRVAICA